MKLTRLDLDGATSPLAIAAKIHALEPELPLAVPVEELCERLDIVGIEDAVTENFEAALITDALKAEGAILVAKGRAPTRRR